MIQAETAANSLKTAGETISDSLLMVNVVKGLPSEFKTFNTVVTQREKKMNFTDFKVSLRRFEETEKCQRMPSKRDTKKTIERRAGKYVTHAGNQDINHSRVDTRTRRARGDVITVHQTHTTQDTAGKRIRPDQ